MFWVLLDQWSSFVFVKCHIVSWDSMAVSEILSRMGWQCDHSFEVAYHRYTNLSWRQWFHNCEAVNQNSCWCLIVYSMYTHLCILCPQMCLWFSHLKKFINTIHQAKLLRSEIFQILGFEGFGNIHRDVRCWPYFILVRVVQTLEYLNIFGL